MSVVVLEAMEAGKPVVVTNVGENGHVISDGNDGFITEPGDIQKMAAILARLIENRRLREHVGKMAQAKVRTQISVEKMVLAYQKLYTLDEVL
jgi:glycosyltransferase involved in cell wall biosynthesis